MKQEFIAYLKSIGVPDVVISKVRTIYEFYSQLCPDEIGDIFVTDYLQEDGSRQYENLWFFSKKYCMEAKQFLTNDNFDITPVQKRIVYLRIQKQDYDFTTPTDKSRMHLHLTFDTLITGDLKASKENCGYLKDIVLRHVMPNTKE